jgi:hypothetical protein
MMGGGFSFLGANDGGMMGDEGGFGGGDVADEVRLTIVPFLRSRGEVRGDTLHSRLVLYLLSCSSS